MATAWLVIGFTGQVLLFGRWVVQWWMSERAGSPVIPLGYWYMSLAGGVALFLYAAHKRDPVFILGTAVGLAIYLRNLALWRRDRLRRAEATACTVCGAPLDAAGRSDPAEPAGAAAET